MHIKYELVKLTIKEGVGFMLCTFLLFVICLPILYIIIDCINQFLKGVIVFLWSEETHNDHGQHFPVQVSLKLVDDVSLHGPLLVLVKWVPSDAHDHVIDRPIFHFSKSKVDASNKL